MPPPTTREVKRPRLAWNCVVCRRRKVKCGKEQPQCHNCTRLGETCVYNIGTRDPSTGRVLRPAGDENRESPERNQRNHDEQPLSNSEDPIRGKGQGKAPGVKVSEDRMLLPGYLSAQQGSRFRYIGNSFWGSVSDQEKLNDEFFYNEPEHPADLPPPHISSTLLAKALHALPTKPLCDDLFNCFMISVHPIYPVIDQSAFQSDWHDFWERCRKGDLTSLTWLIQDPTFICLLFAVLFAGASVASHSAWSTSIVQNSNENDTADQLKTACLDTLAACRHTEHPTLNTLTASILIHHFIEKKSLEKALFVSTVFRLAQSMGLHQEWDALVPDTEKRRRVWWHIVWLDVQTSIYSGLPMCYGSDMLDGVQMLPGTDESPDDASVIMLYTIGQHKIARLQSQIIHHLQGARRIPQSKIADLATDIEVQLHHSIDRLISKIPVQGFPDRGMFPSRFANASPQSLPSLYNDEAKEPSVLGAWARIMLLLLKLETVIMLQKPFLESPDSPTGQSSWESITRLCLHYLEMYLLFRNHIFEPYAWFCSRCHGPRQCALLILLLLIHRPRSSSEEERAMIFCVDETLEYCASRQKPVLSSGDQTDSLLSLGVLARLRRRLNEDRAS
ncbi:hypothetical protein N7512_009842 [Penicillium capsulatum]|nr:hypothetical protein N7512_009842 [Penicillium capsulatum]